MSDVILSLLSALISIVMGFALFRPIEWILSKFPGARFIKFLEKAGFIKKVESQTFQERIEKSMKILREASSEVDSIISEVSQIASERESRVTKLQNRLDSLASQELELQNRIAVLEKVPVQVVNEFENILRRGDKRNALRDYVLFGCGVVLSVLVTIILKKFGI